MNESTFDRLTMYLKWAEDLDLDYDQTYGVDDPDFLVQISRDGIEDQIEEDVSVFTKEELNKIKETDLFILDNIKNSSRWLSSDHSKPKNRWWWHLDTINSGEMEKLDVDKIFEYYNI